LRRYLDDGIKASRPSCDLPNIRAASDIGLPNQSALLNSELLPGLQSFKINFLGQCRYMSYVCICILAYLRSMLQWIYSGSRSGDSICVFYYRHVAVGATSSAWVGVNPDVPKLAILRDPAVPHIFQIDLCRIHKPFDQLLNFLCRLRFYRKTNPFIASECILRIILDSNFLLNNSIFL
jgi:hypothetical protein